MKILTGGDIQRELSLISAKRTRLRYKRGFRLPIRSEEVKLSLDLKKLRNRKYILIED